MDSQRVFISQIGGNGSGSSSVPDPNICTEGPKSNSLGVVTKYIFHPAIAIVKNIPKSVVDDKSFKLKWLEDSLKSLNIYAIEVVGLTRRYNDIPHGIIFFGAGEVGMTRAVFLEQCFQMKGKGRAAWDSEPSSQRKGVYMWAANEKDLYDVKDYLPKISLMKVSNESLEAAAKDAQKIGAGVVELITQAREEHEKKLMQGMLV